MQFEQCHNKIEIVLKNNCFLVSQQKNADVMTFLLAPRFQKVCD